MGAILLSLSRPGGNDVRDRMEGAAGTRASTFRVRARASVSLLGRRVGFACFSDTGRQYQPVLHVARHKYGRRHRCQAAKARAAYTVGRHLRTSQHWQHSEHPPAWPSPEETAQGLAASLRIPPFPKQAKTSPYAFPSASWSHWCASEPLCWQVGS